MTRNIILFLHVMVDILYSYATEDSLGQIHRDFWNWRKKESPWFMTTTGINKYNDRLDSYNISKFKERKEEAERFYQRLQVLPQNSLPYKDKIEHEIFMDYLNTFIQGYKWKEALRPINSKGHLRTRKAKKEGETSYSALNPMNFLEGMHTRPGFVAQASPFNSQGDFLNYLIRLKHIPKQVDELIERLKQAIVHRRTNHRVSLTRVPDQISDFLTDKPEDLVFCKSFNQSLEEMADISGEAKLKAMKEALEYCHNIITSWTKMKHFIQKEYMKYTREGHGVGSWDNGKEFYKACLKWHLSLDMSPEEVFNLGQQEVQRIMGNMKKVMKRLSHTGSVREFFTKMKMDPSLSKATKEQVLQEYKRILKDRIRPVLPKYFKNIPDLPMRIKELPFDGPGALYSFGSSDGERPATFYVNTYRATTNPVFNFMALTLHEAEPGHHLQVSYAFLAKLPAYRRNLEINDYFEVPFNFPFYTAYVEGWGLYAEYLGEEMGLYKDDYELMGRYGMEIFRACRLVVDTGIHYFNWSRQQAIDYMLNYTVLQKEIVINEIDRYITWPGQACAYKIGEIKIREFRDSAEKQLGKDFDIRKFHSIVLENGPMPLRVLKHVVDNWVSDTKNSLLNRQSECENSAHTGEFTSIWLLTFSILFYLSSC